MICISHIHKPMKIDVIYEKFCSDNFLANDNHKNVHFAQENLRFMAFTVCCIKAEV